jgi:hypothetical protein
MPLKPFKKPFLRTGISAPGTAPRRFLPQTSGKGGQVSGGDFQEGRFVFPEVLFNLQRLKIVGLLGIPKKSSMLLSAR